MKRLDRSARARPGAPRSPASGPVEVETDLDILEMGARGDAVAEGQDGPIYVPYTLPGERVRARVAGARAALVSVLTPSPDRALPPCAQFGRCGGCQLQHWSQSAVLAWKREQVRQALARRGVETDVEETRPAFADGRRRATFHALRASRGVAFGFVVRGGGGIVNAPECPILAPKLAAELPGLRRLAEAFAPAKGELTLATLLTESGLDVDVKGASFTLRADRAKAESAAALAEQLDLARLSFEGEVAVRRRAPEVRMGLARVEPPPSAFLQPTASGEELLGALAMEALGGCDRVADLFCGVGTFALRAAVFAEAHAVEGDAAMLVALKRAADRAGGALKTVTTERRDLLRAPLSSLELKRFDGVVFDPPRSGARLQAEQIGASKASRVAAVSCDPATFARDARVLIDAGFRLDRVTPVDQFRWSPHVEVVGAFSR